MAEPRGAAALVCEVPASGTFRTNPLFFPTLADAARAAAQSCGQPGCCRQHRVVMRTASGRLRVVTTNPPRGNPP